MRLSLRYRLLLPLSLLLVGDLAATAWAAADAARSADRALAERLWRVADTLTDPRSRYPLKDWVLEQMKGFSGAEFLLVQHGLPSVTTFTDPAIAPPDVPAAVPATGGDHQLGPPVRIGDDEFRCLRLQLREPHRDAGSDLYIFYPESLRRTAIRDAVRPLVILGALGGLLAVTLAVAIGRQVVRRVGDLEQRTRLIAAGDFRPMPLPRADDELKDLCRSVNDMALRLAEFQDALQRTERLHVLGQFSGGLAHQLRNAATGARLAIEIFLAENPATDPEPLTVALRQLTRIENNLLQFLHLGKPPDGERQLCDLVKLIDQAVTLLQPQCQHAGVKLVWSRPATARTLQGDATQFSHLVGNIIGNAVEAAGPGGTVTVRILERPESPNRFCIEVADTGPGPPEQIAAKLFEPFVTGKPEGIGLGLAVASQAALAHGGRIDWERVDSRTVFRIELPG